MKNIMTFSSLLVLFTLSVFNPAKAQIFTNYTVASTSNQLPGNEVNAIAIDAQGNKWFGTADGVSKFDGTNWTNYDTLNSGLLSDIVTSIAIDAQGNKWFGASDPYWLGGERKHGVSKFDGSTWTSYTKSDGLINGNVNAIAIDSHGNKWFGTDGGVSKFDGVTWTNYTSSDGLLNNQVTSIAIDTHGNKWFGTGSGVSKFNDTIWTTYDTTNSGLHGQVVSSVAIDDQGNTWIGTFDWGYHGRRAGHGVFKFDGMNWTNFTSKDGLAGNIVNGIAIDTKGNKWFATCGISNLDAKGGVSKFDDTTWTTYDKNNSGLPINAVCSIVTDSDDNIWLTGGFWKSGPEAGSFLTSFEVYKFDGTNWTNYKANGLSGNWVNAIAIDAEGNKWFGTTYYQSQKGGISKLNGSAYTSYTTADHFVNDNISSIAIDAQGNKWVGTDNGVLKFDGTNLITYTTADGLADNYVYTMAIDAHGNKWFGTRNGVSKFDGITWTNFTSANGLSGNEVTAIATDHQGNIFIGARDDIGAASRLSKFDGTTWSTYSNTFYLINSIAIDDQSNIWVGTVDGVSKYDGTQWTNFTTANGLAGYNVMAIAIDDQDNKWFGTYGGVSKFDGTHWKNYSYTDGLAGESVMSIAIDDQGNKWFGTNNGVSKLSAEVSTAINPAINKILLSIYPNPVQNALHINSSGKTGMIEVFDLTGKSVLKNQIQEDNPSIDVSGLTNGIYLLKVLSDSQLVTAKFIKQ